MQVCGAQTSLRSQHFGARPLSSFVLPETHVPQRVPGFRASGTALSWETGDCEPPLAANVSQLCGPPRTHTSTSTLQRVARLFTARGPCGLDTETGGQPERSRDLSCAPARSGRRIRTVDIRVMSPARYLCAIPHRFSLVPQDYNTPRYPCQPSTRRIFATGTSRYIVIMWGSPFSTASSTSRPRRGPPG